MIETQLFFMNEVSDFPLCNHSMLILSNHSFIYVLFLHFHFFCLVLCNLAVLRSFGRLVCSLALYLLWALTMRLCQAVSYTFCYFFYFNADNLFSLLCEILLQFRMLRILVVCDLTLPAGLWLTDIFSLWRACVNICCLIVHSNASEVVPEVFSFLFLIVVHSSESDAGQERLRKDVFSSVRVIPPEGD